MTGAMVAALVAAPAAQSRPAKPTGLRAAVDGRSVFIEWDAADEPALDYILEAGSSSGRQSP